jgi:hypothetical protein
MNSFRQILNKYSPLLPMLVSLIAFFIENPYLGLIYSIVTVILVTFILERLSRKQLFNVFLFEVPNVSVSFLETQFRFLGHTMTMVLNPVTGIIISIYIYRCRRLRQVGPPKKLEPSQPLKITLTLRCPKCGAELLTDAEFCRQCGTKLPPQPISK